MMHLPNSVSLKAANSGWLKKKNRKKKEEKKKNIVMNTRVISFFN